MKRISSSILMILVSSSMVFGGGLVTNTNQSAAWARTLTRQATWDADAVYFNPAGLGVMDKGLHLSVSNQFITQTQQITNNYQFLEGAPVTYEGDVQALLFPSIYASYKMEKLAISAGFNVIGGGGGADFQDGLPSFEVPIASLVPMLQGALAPIDQATGGIYGFSNITGYNMEAPFKGTSAYLGFQLGATYAINDLISVALGARYVSVKNTYEGSLTGITIDAPAAYGGTQPAGTYLRTVGDAISTANPAGAAQLYAYATLLDAQTADKYVEVTQKGGGFTPIVGVNLHLSDMINIGLKYEHHTKIEIENQTTADDVNMFPDGEKTRADLPGQFSGGIQLKPLNKLTASVGFNTYFDKSAYYGQTDDNGNQINNETTIDKNAYDVGVSVEYKLLGILGLSAGFSTGNIGVNDGYQSDLNYALKTSSVAGGVFIDLGKMITLNAGYVHIMYTENSVSNSYTMGTPPNTTTVPFVDTFNKKTSLFAIGIDIDL